MYHFTFFIQTDILLNSFDNSSVTHHINVPVQVVTGASQDLPFTVEINTTRDFWENNYTDNVDTESTTLLPPYNPTTAPATGCPVGSTNNYTSPNFAQYEKSYSATRKTYSNFANSTAYSTYVYNAAGAQTSRWTSYNEAYEITDVRFRSKVTDDNAWKYDTGYSEWESIYGSNANAAVRAGNGYELEIDVRYSSNALVNPNRSSESGRGTAALTGTRQSNSRHKANVYKDIYVRTHDGKVYSATGMFGTEAAFTPTIVEDRDGLVRMTYTMRTVTDKNGNNIPYRIYTNETAKDGSYDLRIWTPTLTGFGHGDKPTIELCDSHLARYQVKGSMYDDLQDSIIQ